MPGYSFEKELSPRAPIDLSLFAHILNDPFIGGAYRLEGNAFIRTVSYLYTYFDTIPKPLPDAVLILKKKLKTLVQITVAMDSIYQTAVRDVPKAQEDLKGLSYFIATTLLTGQKEGDYLSMPGGWHSAEVGHAMVYQFKRVADGFEFYVYNTGDGIHFHERKSDLDKELYYPVQAYHLPLPQNTKKLETFLHQLMLPRFPMLRSQQERSFDAEQLYHEVLPNIAFLNASQISIAGRAEHAFTAGQLSGTCAQRVLHHMLKENFDDLPSYQRFIYEFQRYALGDYLRVLTNDKGLGDFRIHCLINKAINTLLRTLNTPNLFDAEYVARECESLLQLKPSVLKDEDITFRTELFLNAEPKEIGPLYSYFIQTRGLSVAIAGAYAPKEASPLRRIEGGMDLLAQLDKLLAEVNALQVTHPSLIVEGLESVFVSFPLPKSDRVFYDPIDYYKGIRAENQMKFYDHILALNQAYRDACTAISSEALLPRMFVVGLSVTSVVDYVSGRLSPLSQSYHFTFHDALGRFIRKPFECNQFNPWFATNHPLLDARLQWIKSLYMNPMEEKDVRHDYYYYAEIINSEPSLKGVLQQRYRAPSDNDFARQLKEGALTELYCFTSQESGLQQEQVFKPLLEKFEVQHKIEEVILRALQAFVEGTDKNDVQKIRLKFSYGYLYAEYTLSRFAHARHVDSLNDFKYELKKDSAIQSALRLDYNNPEFRELLYINSLVKRQLKLGSYFANAIQRDSYLQLKLRSDNHIQLLPANVSKKTLADEDYATIAMRTIGKEDIVSREFFVLRASPRHQIKLTLDYAARHLSKLSDIEYQIYVEANLFEPGLLLTELDENPEFLTMIDDFIADGLRHFAEKGMLSQTSIFFIRLAYLVNHYVAMHKPSLLSRLEALKEQLTVFVNINADNSPAIKHSVHQYQFLTAMACLKGNISKTILDDETLNELVSAYFYINSYNNPDAFIDSASRFDLQCVKNEFMRRLARYDGAVLGRLISHALATLGLGVSGRLPTKGDDNFYHVTTIKEGMQHVYKVDVLRGLVLNTKGMAYSPIPLDILHHPVMKFLELKAGATGLMSADALCFEIGDEASLRFVKKLLTSGYRVQKQWSVNGSTQWYELHHLTEAHQEHYGLETERCDLPCLPNHFKERETQIWVPCTGERAYLIVENNRPSYLYHNPQSVGAMKQLDADGHETGFLLCDKNQELSSCYDGFEASQFTAILRKGNALQIKFYRYNLTLIGSREKNGWVFCLEDSPSYVLSHPQTVSLSNVPGLFFEDKHTLQRVCYLPVQQFVSRDEPSPHSEFYNLKLDVTGEISKKVVETGMDAYVASMLLWQYTGSQRFIRYAVDADNQLQAETSCDALYLCYVYLGSQQPEQAWRVLEYAVKRLGGLHGTADELIVLNWILNSLPCVLDKEDSKAVISAPSYVACQLKALALFAAASKPDKPVSFPHKTFDLKTPEGIYHSACWSEVQSFYQDLNKSLYSLYSRFQTMRRHLTHDFYLSDDERINLLDYYHFNLPEMEPKALGALGHEWHHLRLKVLKQEAMMLLANQQVKGPLPKAYEQRLKDIDVFLKKEATVSAHRTQLELLRIDLSIPKDLSFNPLNINEYNALYYTKRQAMWWSTGINVVTLDKAMHAAAAAALTPSVTDMQMFEYFPVYFKWVRAEKPSEEQKNLLDFCAQYLIAHRHVPLNKQRFQTAYLCNLLYRLHQHKDLFSKTDGVYFSSSDLLKEIQKLPDPELKIYQTVNTTSSLLSKTSELWTALTTEVLVPTTPMCSSPCKIIADYSVERLIQKSQLDERLKMRFDYTKQARIFGMPSEVLKGMEGAPRNAWNILERKAGREQYESLQATKSIACEMLSDVSVRQALKKTTSDFIASLKALCEKQLDDILNLANRGPNDPLQKQRRDLELKSAARTLLDKDRLLGLYFKADEASYAYETGLPKECIEQLHSILSHFVALSTRQLSLERLYHQLEIADETPDTLTLQKIAHELLTEDEVDHQNEPVLATLQYHEDLLLRPQQINAIKALLASPSDNPYSYFEWVIKIIMGGGKSKVVLPSVAQCKATGNLVVKEVPRSMFETNYADLSYTSGRLFNQKAFAFKFNRESNCTLKALRFLHSQLRRVMVNKDYVVTTKDAVQSLELKFLECLLQGPVDESENDTWVSQVSGLATLVALFRYQADGLMDEVHQALLFKEKLNYTGGKKRPIPADIINACVELYRFFDKISLSTTLGDGFRGVSLSAVLDNPQLIKEHKQWEVVMADVAKALLEHPESPLQLMLSKMKPSLTESDKMALYDYLINKGTEIPASVLRAKKKEKNVFALYKEQLNLLPKTLKCKFNANYGPSQQRPEEDIAIPYIANDVPNERSRFGNPLKAMNLTIQMLVIGGFSRRLLKQSLLQLQVQARQELLKVPSLDTIDNTPTARGFRGIVPDFRFTLGEICLDDELQFEAVFNTLRHNKPLIFEVLKTDILRKIHIDSEVLHSDSSNHVSIYRSAQGITGTPENSGTYDRLRYLKEKAAATDGFILEVLVNKKTAIRALTYSSPTELLQALFKNNVADKPVRALIDICAAFQGIPNGEVAELLATYIEKNPTQFSTSIPLKYILFFNKENVLCALDIGKRSAPIVIRSSDPDVINATLGCKPEARFTYYDQSHVIGVDIQQSSFAKAYILVDHETHLQHFLQGSLRMRGLQNEQSVEVIVPTHFKVDSLETLFEHMNANEAQQLQQDNFSAAQSKMRNLVRNDFIHRLLALKDDVKNMYCYAQAFKPYFVETPSEDFFTVYGGLATMRSAKDILAFQRDRLIVDWSAILKGLGERVDDLQSKHLCDSLNNIIKHALPLCGEEYLSPTSQEHGDEVEVEKETQIELEHQLELEREQFDPSLKLNDYQPWNGVLPREPYRDRKDCVSLSAMCAKGAPNAPRFGEVYATLNYCQVYQRQEQFIGAYLKPVHALFFRMQRNGEIDCLIVSQQEADEFAEVLHKKYEPNVWLSTMQSTVLAGRPPQNIQANKQYQLLIEQVCFFAGALSLLLNSKISLNWLSEHSALKLEYFKTHLLPYRETTDKDWAVLSQSLSQRQNALRYIAAHPFEQYKSFEWHEIISEELSDADIDECERLATAFERANAQWKEARLDLRECEAGLQLSMQASSHISAYVDQLASIRKDFLLDGKDKIDTALDSLLPVLFSEYLPLEVNEHRISFQFVLKKMSATEDTKAFESMAEHLLNKGVKINERNPKGYTALDLVLQDDEQHALQAVNWLLRKGVNINDIHQDTWPKVSSKMMRALFTISIFQYNEAFLLAYVTLIKEDKEALTALVLSVTKSTVLKKIIELEDAFSENMLLAFLKTLLFVGNTELVQLLLKKLEGEERAEFIATLLFSKNIGNDVLTLLLPLYSPLSVESYIELLDLHQKKFEEKQLIAMLSALFDNKLKVDKERLAYLLKRIAQHMKYVSEDILNSVMTYALTLDEDAFELFFNDFMTCEWALLGYDSMRDLAVRAASNPQLTYSLMTSKAFSLDKDRLISQFISFNESTVSSMLLNQNYIQLQPKQLLDFLTIDRADLQDWLLCIAKHSSADVSVFDALIAAADNPPKAFWEFLLNHPEVTTSETLLLKINEKAGEVIRASGLTLPVLLGVIEGGILHLDKACALFDNGAQLQASHLTLMLRALPYLPSVTERLKAQELLCYIIKHECSTIDILSEAIGCALKVSYGSFQAFWHDVAENQQWDKILGDTLRKVLLHCDVIADDFFKSSAFLDNQDNVRKKIFDSWDPKVYQVLLKAHLFTIKPDELITILRKLNSIHKVEPVLLDIALYPASDASVLTLIIEFMIEPSMDFLKRLSTCYVLQNDQVLIKQLLEKLDVGAYKKFLDEWALENPLVKSVRLSLDIQRAKGDASTLQRVITDHQLDKVQLILVLQSLLATRVVTDADDDTLGLLRSILAQNLVDDEVLELMVTFALQFRSLSMGAFWKNFQFSRWDTLNGDILAKMVANLSAGALENLFTSQIFMANRVSIFDKLFESADKKVYIALLKNTRLNLDQDDLRRMIDMPQHNVVNSLLPDIVVHRAADESILERILDRASELSPDLLGRLLMNKTFVSCSGLIEKLFQRLPKDGECHQKVLRGLAGLSGLPKEVIKVIIKENEYKILGIERLVDSYQLLDRAYADPNYRQLFHNIQKMRQYGQNLHASGFQKGNIAIMLADDLKKRLEGFILRSYITPSTKMDLAAFKTDFNRVLHTRDHEMQEHRTEWKTILANIFIALTGIGLLFLVGKAFAALGCQQNIRGFNKSLFFAKTRCQELVEDIDKTTNAVSVI